MVADETDRNIIHGLRHSTEFTSETARQKEIIRHAIAHDLLRIPIAGFTAVDARTSKDVHVQYDPAHPLESNNAVEFIFTTDEHGQAELIIVPKQDTIKITNITLSYTLDDNVKDFDLVPQPFQRDAKPLPYDFSHHLYKVKKGQANVDPLFGVIRIMEKNKSVKQNLAEYRESLRVGAHRREQEYEPPRPVVQSRYIPREARAPEVVASVSG